MNSNRDHSPLNPQLASRARRRAMQILLAALVAFGPVVPTASAKCFKDLTTHGIVPTVSNSVTLAEHSDAILLNGPVSIVGLWNVTFSSGGEVVDVAFDVWHSDGTEILNDYTNPIEGNVCLGVWEQAGPRSYKLKHPSWSFDTNGNLLGTVWISEIVTVSANGNSYEGSYKYDIYDTTGAFIEEFTGTIKATRIVPN
jgi:hypothetical protein